MHLKSFSPNMTIYVEDWQAAYGAPYLVQPDDQGDQRAELIEDGHDLVCRRPRNPAPRYPIAFVDGVRRGEAALYQQDPATGAVARGVAGSHACGAVIATAGRIEFANERVRRLAIWGSGLTGELPGVAGGWDWSSRSIASTEPDAPLKEVQERMRQAEGVLAESMSEQGHLVVVDGPLNYVRSRDLPVVGYVKTHHRALLDPEHHRLIPSLEPGERTSLFRLRDDRYSCYLRLTPASRLSGPWAGIVRLEVPQSPGLAAASRVADEVAATIPRYAGVPHRDPRAPQNLQPIGALETHLRHLLGDPGLAYRAVREAVAASLEAGVR
jgi:hypothetical protein